MYILNFFIPKYAVPGSVKVIGFQQSMLKKQRWQLVFKGFKTTP
jgi:hypothetical protein